VSRRLVVAYVIATILIVAGVTFVVGFALYTFSNSGYGYTPQEFASRNMSVLAATALLTALFILGASLFRTSVLSAGGGRVATDMGGTLVPADVQDPLRRRLRNVVEEMAIASGVPVPEIYVLEQESGINAFAAGFTPGDAAIAVTRGALELLDRDELQGVIGHEFSHILNGDMRLNIRLMGILFGIMALGLIGRLVVRGGYHTSIVSSRRNRGTPAILVVGLGLVILGSIGVFFARLIKAGVSRQREFLADASAVQFTRQTGGIANALKKIGGYREGSMLRSADPEEISHMLFGTGAAFSSLFATHPPLVDRIRALDPTFTEADFPRVDPRPGTQSVAVDDRGAAGFAGGITTALAAGGAQALAESIADTVGDPDNQHVEYSRSLRQSIPAELYDAAHAQGLAYLLTIALVLDRSGRSLQRQLALARDQLGGERTRLLRNYYDLLSDTDARFRLPLLEVAFPVLKRRPAPELAFLVSLTARVIETDGDVDLYEYCFYRILTSNLGQATDPSGRRAPVRAGREALRRAAIGLIRIMAEYGHSEPEHKRAAFRAGTAMLGPWAAEHKFGAQDDRSVATLDASLDILLGLNSKGKEALVRAISATAGHDGTLTVSEAELIRAVCATLDYPLPPILVHYSVGTNDE